MLNVTAKEKLVYDGMPRRKGERFNATPEDARVLRMIGKVSYQDAQQSEEQTVDAPITPEAPRRGSRRKSDDARA